MIHRHIRYDPDRDNILTGNTSFTGRFDAKSLLFMVPESETRDRFFS